MSGIEGAKVEIYYEKIAPEQLVEVGYTDEKGFYRTRLRGGHYFFVVTWTDPEGVERRVTKEETLMETTQVIVNLPARVLLPMCVPVEFEPTVVLAPIESEVYHTIPPILIVTIEGVPVGFAPTAVVGDIATEVTAA